MLARRLLGRLFAPARPASSRAARPCCMEACESRQLLSTSVLTWHNNLSRDGANLTETQLTPTNVRTSTFGKKRSLHVDGAIYAQPLYVSGLNVNGTTRNVVFVATQHDSVYAFDSDS